MKCYAELPCSDIEDISQEIYSYLRTKPEIINTTKYGWHFIDCRELLERVPKLVNFFRQYNLIPRHAAITVVTSSEHLPKHVDEPPVIAKINFPVINTEGWANRWYDEDIVIAELNDMKLPIAFNSQIPHSVEKTTAISIPRIVASFTFFNEPLELLK